MKSERENCDALCKWETMITREMRNNENNDENDDNKVMFNYAIDINYMAPVSGNDSVILN